MLDWYKRKRFRRKAAPGFINAVAILFMLLMMGMQTVSAQTFVVKGTVLSATDNTPLPGVNIVEVGTLNGTATDIDGTYTLAVTSPSSSIAASFIGFVTQTIEVAGQTDIIINLAEDIGLLEEVVVTAGGIERKERAVGFSITKISGEDLRQSRENNVVNALAGKVAGVLVSKPATGPAGSSRVIIRGASSLGEDSQPLYVVDGVPIDNTTLGSAGMWGGSDGGDGISGINPDDIENISVLKGPAAAALYGTRAKNGVILITTKKAQPGVGLGIEFSSNTTFEDLLVNTDWQTEYGQGFRGLKPENADEARSSNLAAWGARLDGSSVINWDGVNRPYSLVKDQQGRFYDSGLTATNSLALTSATQNSSIRLGFSHLQNNGISPNSGLERTTFTLRGTANFGTRLSADAKLNFVRENVKNRPRLSDSPGNANYTIYQLAPNVDPVPMRGTQEATGGRPGTTESDQELAVTGSIFSQNPYFAAENFTAADEDRRLIGFTSLTYQFNDWLSLMGRFGGDTYTTRRTNITPYGTGYNPLGGQNEQEFRITEVNTDFLFLAQRQLTSSVGVTANFGGNILYREDERLTLSGSGGFNVPGLEVVTNQNNRSHGYSLSEKQINSFYGSAEFAYNDYLFVTVTGRNDWSSTLPVDNNSYFYPSISGSFVFSDAFAMPSWMTFGKVRASWAEVGGDTSPYQLALTYSLQGSHLGQPRGGVAQGRIPLAALKPSSTVGKEIGVDIRVLDGRLGVDFTLYTQSATDQILSTTISNASGFGSQVINAGEIKNSGVELLLTTTPVRTSDFRWDFDVNLAKNTNEVVDLIEGQTSLVLAESRRRGNFVTADVGEPYGSIKGRKYLRQNVPSGGSDCDATGPIVHDSDGLPMRTGDLCVLGNGTPDVIGGVSNSIRYKNFTIRALIDMRFGGEIFSYTNSQGYSAGLHQATLQGREGAGIVGDGVDQNGSPNTVSADPQDYFGRIGSQIGEQFIYDAGFVKLRELQISYRLPTRLLAGSPIKLAVISLVGRNLWLISSDVDNVDPESTFRNDQNGLGLEHSGVPQTRSIGFNISVRL